MTNSNEISDATSFELSPEGVGDVAKDAIAQLIEGERIELDYLQARLTPSTEFARLISLAVEVAFTRARVILTPQLII